MLKITATNLEAYRLFCETDYKSFDELISQIKKEPIVETHNLKVGKNYHEYLFEEKEAKYPFNDLDKDLLMSVYFAGGTFEVWGDTETIVNGCNVLLLGRCDCLKREICKDLKVKLGSYKLSDYADSLQWPFYCEVFEVPAFEYVVAKLNKDYELTDSDSLRLYIDSSTRLKLYNWCSRFLDFCNNNDLLDFIDTDIRKEAA